MAQGLKHVVIVGGGSAGWMTATALATALRGRCTVELVESEEIGIIGVGEATFPSIREFNRLAGIDEKQFLRATNGTYKLGIQFCNWLQQGHSYFHTFGHIGNLTGAQTLWAQHRRAGMTSALGLQCLPSVMAMEGRFDLSNAQAEFNYAYHFDALQYAAFLRTLAVQRGTRHTQGRIVEVPRREDGGVAALVLADGRRISGDLYVDCSGFGSLLLGKTLEEPYVDFSHWLPVDGAWACPCERVGEDITPYTRSTALDGGWAWRIPLQSRTGHGHVFASRFVDTDQAREQLMGQLDGPALAEPRLLRFTTGHRQRFWVHNVVGVGLSAGFLEPLESTAIFLIQDAIHRLLPALVMDRPLSEDDLALFNDGQARRFARVRDFIILHYCLTQRRDSALWRHVSSMELPETLAYKMELWRRYGVLHQYDEEAFDATSWLAIHAGMEHWPERLDPVVNEVPAERAAQALLGRQRHLMTTVSRMKTHWATLQEKLK